VLLVDRSPALPSSGSPRSGARVAVIFSLLAILGISACSPVVELASDRSIPVAMLLNGAPVAGTELPAQIESQSEILAVTEPMRAFVREHVAALGTDDSRLQDLLRALFIDGGFKLEYDDRTRTAAETFAARRGNCLSFTNMFVALAREAGLRASFQEVDVPPTWIMDGDVLLLSRHINVSVSPTYVGEHVVDFNIADFHASYPRQRVSDARGLAHFYSNLGAEQLRAGTTPAALSYFRRAIEIDPRFGAPWCNLGVLYLRAGYPAWAEAAWRQALSLTPQDPAVMSNLVSLFERQGREDEASRFRGQIARYRMSNPYFRYMLAKEAFDAADYGAAIGHLKFAIRQQPNDDSFYALLGLSYLKRHDMESARRWFAKAAEVSAEEPLKSVYNRKLEMLKAAAAGG
jgi:Flp pilus assembly protein TadD